jgi:hypothetical protein
VPFGLMPVTAAMTAMIAASTSQVSQVMPGAYRLFS